MAKTGRPRKNPETEGGIRLVWLGEETGEMRETVWNGVTFRVGVPTAVDDPVMIATTRGNRFYEVIE